MNGNFLILEQPCDEAVDWVIHQIHSAGLQVLRTFDLQFARLAHTECSCPNHGTNLCDCQMVILLVYAGHFQPVSLVAHSYDGKTWFSLVNTPHQRADPGLESTIRRVLKSQNTPPFHQQGWSQAS